MNDKLYRWDATVRDYEIDSQGIVNNATYVNYLEQARANYVRSLGIDFDEYEKAGYLFVVAALNIQYRAPLKATHEFYVTAKIAHYDEKYMSVEQEIRLKETNKLVAKSLVSIACMNRETGRASCPDMLKKFYETLK
jgi:acyl-CoA thioester hydrolase